MTTIPNYRLNFAKWDDAAFEWFTDYESSVVYPTEETEIEVSTLKYLLEEKETTIFEHREESSTSHSLDSDEDSKIQKENTTESSEEEDSQEVEDEASKVDDDLISNLSGGLVLRGLSFVTFMVVPFVMLL